MVNSSLRRPWLPTALIALLCLIWGSTWLVVKWGLHDLPPFTGASLRFLIAGLIMAALAPRLAPAEGGSRPNVRLVASVGLCQFTISYAIVYWTEQTLPSGLVSVIWAVFPLMLAGCSVVYLPGERLTGRQWSGFIIAFAGVASLFVTDVRAVGVDAVPNAVLLLGSPAISAVATVYLKRHGEGASSVLLNRNAMLLAGAMLGGVALVFERDAPAVWSLRAWLCVLYLAIAGTVVTFGVYLWLMRTVAAYRMSLIAYVTPAIALLLGTALDDEPLEASTIVGSAVILVGVAIATRRVRTRTVAA